MQKRLRFLLCVVPLLLLHGVTAQQPVAPQTDRRIVLDVVVAPKSGAPVAGLAQKDFAVLDNKAPRGLTSFRAVSGKEAAVEVIVVVDAVNATYQNVAFERDQIDRFLRANGGRLSHPTSLAVVSDTGSQIQEGFSLDGNALSAELDKYTISLRTIRRSSGYYGAEDRLRLSINAMTQLAQRESSRPGRKVVLWVSPGWPLLSGPGTDLDTRQRDGIFANVVRLSTVLRQGRVTLYSIDPLGTADAGGFRIFYYKDFLKGVGKANDVQLGDLGLQVLAEQSGGLALNSSNDVSALLERCIADLGTYYEMSFDSLPADGRDEYHHIEVQVDQPGLTARTRQGYYAQP